MRSRIGQATGPLVAFGAALLVAACTLVVPLAGGGEGDGGVTPPIVSTDPDAGTSPTVDADPPPDGTPGQGDDGGPMCSDQPISLPLVPPQAIIAFDRSSTMVDSRVDAV